MPYIAFRIFFLAFSSIFFSHDLGLTRNSWQRWLPVHSRDREREKRENVLLVGCVGVGGGATQELPNDKHYRAYRFLRILCDRFIVRACAVHVFVNTVIFEAHTDTTHRKTIIYLTLTEKERPLEERAREAQ